jgi:glycerophosphoryl diester phosphodiesterase
MNLVIHRGKINNCQENSIEGINAINDIIHDSIIEIDISPTKDDRAILFHDLSLNRLCNIDIPIFTLKLDELNKIQNLYIFTSLEDILNIFPNQKFLLDLRCNLHPDFFPTSNIDISAIKINLKDKMLNSLQKILKNEYKNNLTIMCSEVESAIAIKATFPLFQVDISENYLRQYLQTITETKDISIIGFKPSNVHIQNKLLSKELVEIFHKENIKVYSTPSLTPSFENSTIMTEKALKLKVDSIWLNYIDENILSKYFKGKK